MPTNLRPFSLSELSAYAGGELAQNFDALLAAAVRDCVERPTVEKKRTVSIVINVTPVRDSDGTCSDVVLDVQTPAKTPAKQLQPHVMRATVSGGLRYAPDSPTNPDQQVLGFDDEQEGGPGE